jgi:hypothetical protein
MFGFLKRFFGFDDKVYKDAGVHVEQAPYKLEPPVPVTPLPSVVEKAVVSEPTTAPAPVVAGTKPARKPRAQKKPQVEKPTRKPATKDQRPATPARRGRKPKVS